MITASITIAGFANLDQFDKPISGSDQTPDNIPSMEVWLNIQTHSEEDKLLCLFLMRLST